MPAHPAKGRGAARAGCGCSQVPGEQPEPRPGAPRPDRFAADCRL